MNERKKLNREIRKKKRNSGLKESKREWNKDWMKKRNEIKKQGNEKSKIMIDRINS